MKADYINNTKEDLRGFHEIIMKAIERGGVFDEDFEDIFILTKNPPGSGAEYALDFVADERKAGGKKTWES